MCFIILNKGFLYEWAPSYDIKCFRTQGIQLIWPSSGVYYYMRCSGIQDVHARLGGTTQENPYPSGEAVKSQAGCRGILYDRIYLSVGI